MSKINKKFFTVEEFFTPELKKEILELEAAEKFLLSLIGESWRDKILIKKISPPYWTLKILSPIFSRTLSMSLYSKTNQEKFFQKYNYHAKFKFEADPILLGQIREARAKKTVKLPKLLQKEEARKFLAEYLDLEYQEVKNKNTRRRKKYDNYQSIIQNYLMNEENNFSPINKESLNQEKYSEFQDLVDLCNSPRISAKLKIKPQREFANPQVKFFQLLEQLDEDN